jgi:hypothetical protein
MSSPASEEIRAELCRLSGLSPLLAPGVLRRALTDSGVAPGLAGPRDFLKALPKLEARMRAYLTPTDVEQRLLQMKRLIERWTGGKL